MDVEFEKLHVKKIIYYGYPLNDTKVVGHVAVIFVQCFTIKRDQ